MTGELEARLVDLRVVNDFVGVHHRHLKPARGAKVTFGAALRESGQLVGVGTLGRPSAPALDDGRTLEITRVATDGTQNASSFVLARLRRIGHWMGARKVVTFTLPEEGGASLRGAGFEGAFKAGGGCLGSEEPAAYRRAPSAAEAAMGGV